MIIVESLPQSTTHQFFAWSSLLRALSSRGFEIILWDKAEKNIFDLYDEFKPEVLINHTDCMSGIIKTGLRNWSFPLWYVGQPLISDSLVYRYQEPIANLKCQNLCIDPWNDVADNGSSFNKYADSSCKAFRYFGSQRIGGHKDCGTLPEAYYSAFLSSADYVVCRNMHFAVNAILCNEQLLGNVDGAKELAVSTNSIEISKSIL